MTSLLETARLLWRVGITPERVGREGWRATVQDETRRSMASGTRRPVLFAPMTITPEQLRAIQSRERQSASPAEIARAEALGDRADECEWCAGTGVVGRRMTPGELAIHVPCECQPLEARAAYAGIPARYRASTLDTFRPERGKTAGLDAARTWGRARSVVLWGEVGTGKTHLGCGMVIALLVDGLPARFVSVAQLMDELKARFDDGAKEQSQAYFDRIAREHTLLLDDLGKEQETAWTRERVSTLVGRRYETKLPTIITTNLTHIEIADRYGVHLADRLYEWQWVEVAGVSMRRELAVGA